MFCLPTYGLTLESWTTAWPFLAFWIGFKLAVLAAVITALIIGVRWLHRQLPRATHDAPLDILRARYARGELSQSDFGSIKQDLER